MRLVLLAVVAAMFAGCASQGSAPVIERGVPSPAAKPVTPAPVADRASFYTVKKGDTLYTIALDHGQDYKEVAAWNYLENPNLIKVGQQLRVAPPESAAPVAVARPVSSSGPVEVREGGGGKTAAGANTETLKKEPRGGKLPWSEDALAKAKQGEAATREPRPDTKPVEAKPAEKPEEKLAEKQAASDEIEWIWPAGGKLIAGFAEPGNKGIDISAKIGESVVAAAGGTVKYVGVLRGYGNFLVIRHNSAYLSVYAHASKILVKEEQAVTKGQKIAEAGNSDAESPRLHFEIRRQGKPSDPLKFLPQR